MGALTLSVAMPNYNHAEYLPRAIEGIVNQTRPPDEFLILDDGSTDNSVEVIESYARRHPVIRFHRNERNAGLVAAHQQLYELAKCDYLFSAAADDERYPQFFEVAMQLAEQHPEAGVVFGQMVIADAAGNEQATIGASRWHKPLFASPQRYLEEFLDVEPPMHAANAATIFRRDAFEEAGWLRAELGSFSDTLAVRAIALKYGACYAPQKFCSWRRVPGSFSGDTARDGRRSLDIIARADRLMRSPEFADRFPTDYVDRWQRAQRRQVIWNYFLGDDGQLADRPSFLVRNLKRLPRLPETLRLMFYRGDSSC
jgi:glycosyltransferase involved in cell wall biosynthesis